MKLKIATYKDVKSIGCADNGDCFVAVSSIGVLSGHEYIMSPDDMRDYFDGKIIVREAVARKLSEANNVLREINPEISLFVSYGYRTLETQAARFKSVYDECDKQFSGEEKIEFVHTMIAVPEVAGHPTGGAVDVTLYNVKDSIFVDMGCQISDFSSGKFAFYADGLTVEQKKNRQILHDVLVKQKFCPYYGEWWHYSYGDKEWAFFYDNDIALYEQRAVTDIILKK